MTLLYGNRRSDTVMFADEVADLKDAYPARMQIVHVLSREPQEVELHSGRLDAARLTALLPATVDVPAVDHWWLCGPFGYGHRRHRGAARARRGSAAASTASCSRSATSRPPRRCTSDAPVGAGASVTVILDGRSTTLTLPPGTPVLDGGQRARPDLPFACKGGVCGTCRAKIVSGEAAMRRNYALEQRRDRRGVHPDLPGRAAQRRRSPSTTTRSTLRYDA